MATVTPSYSTAESITITLTSLAVDAWRQSAQVDNTTNLYLDAHVGGSIQVGAVTASGTLKLYAYGTYDDVNMSGGVGTTDQAITWGTTGNTSVNGFSQLKNLAILDVDTTDDNNDIYWGPVSVAAAFGGVLPKKWGVAVLNSNDIALNATGTNNEMQFLGIKFDSA